VPTYDYSCEKCGTYELWQSIKDDELAVCPKCGSKVERLISANVGFVLKGSGFYQNEYKNSPSAAAKAEAPPPPAAPACGSCSEAKSCPNASN
jgi:putative FmdB family regulatory protein